MILNAKKLQAFLKKAVQDLEGEWLLVGGTLLPAVGLDVRSTVDIDLVGLSKKEAAQSLELMSLAESMGLQVDSINHAAAYFVNKIGYTAKDFIELKRCKKAVIYRPTVLFYFKLKLGRFSATDAFDCEAYLDYAFKTDDVDLNALKKVLTQAYDREEIREKKARIAGLQKMVAILGRN